MVHPNAAHLTVRGELVEQAEPFDEIGENEIPSKVHSIGFNP